MRYLKLTKFHRLASRHLKIFDSVGTRPLYFSPFNQVSYRMREVGGGGGVSDCQQGNCIIWLINCQLTVIEGRPSKFYYETTKILLLLLSYHRQCHNDKCLCKKTLFLLKIFHIHVLLLLNLQTMIYNNYYHNSLSNPGTSLSEHHITGFLKILSTSDSHNINRELYYYLYTINVSFLVKGDWNKMLVNPNCMSWVL